jgi:hypothetical protein
MSRKMGLSAGGEVDRSGTGASREGALQGVVLVAEDFAIIRYLVIVAQCCSNRYTLLYQTKAY